MRPMAALFLFTIRQTLSSRKIWLTILLLIAPSVLLLIIRNFAPPIDSARNQWEIYHVFAQFLFIMGLVPLVCMVHGTALIGAEVEARTIVYLITRRMRRATVMLVKFFATALVLAVLCDMAMVGLHYCMLAGRDMPSLLAGTSLADWNPTQELFCYLYIIPLAVLSFLAIFSFIGLMSARPLAMSVLYLVTVEMVLSNIPVRARMYSLMHQLRVTMAGALPGVSKLYELPGELSRELYSDDASALPQILGIVVVALLLSAILMTYRELVPTKISRD